jgi:acyl-coenzyme A thioesterase PaaI-like protein
LRQREFNGGPRNVCAGEVSTQLTETTSAVIPVNAAQRPLEEPPAARLHRSAQATQPPGCATPRSTVADTLARVTTTAIQDQIPGNHCWGCGTLNPQGLHIKSYWDGDGTVCTFQPSPQHAAGPPHILNGGIIAAVIDCHSICTALADAYRVAGRAIGTEPPLWLVTASMTIDYLAPCPIGGPVELRARVVEIKGRKRQVATVLSAGGVECARGAVVAVEVPATWRAG